MGLLIFLLFVATLVRACVLGLRSVDQGGHRLAAACAAVLVAGLVLAVVQSYVYAVGNLATLSVWIAAFLPLAQAERWEAR